MIYTSGYFIAFLGLIIMLFNFKDLYPKLNIWGLGQRPKNKKNRLKRGTN